MHVIKDRYFARKIYISHVIATSNKSLRWIDIWRKEFDFSCQAYYQQFEWIADECRFFPVCQCL